MRILLTNDDGVFAPGILSLAKELEKNHEVTIVAPEHENSGKSHAITINQALLVKEVKLEGVKAKAYSISGTPADCIRASMDKLIEDKIDFVFSGTNLGYNAGLDIMYSGTVSAAIEANVFNIPSIAVSSQWVNGEAKFDTASRHAVEIFEKVADKIKGRTMLLNINSPYLEYDEVSGIKVCEIGGPIYDYYFMKEGEDGEISLKLEGRNKIKFEQGTDRYYLKKNFVTVTPLIYDLTNRRLIEEVNSWI